MTDERRVPNIQQAVLAKDQPFFLRKIMLSKQHFVPGYPTVVK
jgi:hypothetical protein